MTNRRTSDWYKAHPGEHYRHWEKSRKRHPSARRKQAARNYARGSAHLTLEERTSRRFYTPADDDSILAHDIPDRDLALIIRRGVNGKDNA